MKKLLNVVFAGVIALGLLSGCATTSGEVTPATVAKKVCPSLEAVQTVLSASPTVSDDIKEQIDEAAPVISAVCSDSVQVSDLQSLRSKIIPTLITVIGLLPIDDEQKNVAVLAIAVVKAALSSL